MIELLFVNIGGPGIFAMLPTTPSEWVRPVIALLLCLTAVALWYGLGALFDHDPSETGSILEH